MFKFLKNKKTQEPTELHNPAPSREQKLWDIISKEQNFKLFEEDDPYILAYRSELERYKLKLKYGEIEIVYFKWININHRWSYHFSVEISGDTFELNSKDPFYKKITDLLWRIHHDLVEKRLDEIQKAKEEKFDNCIEQF